MELCVSGGYYLFGAFALYIIGGLPFVIRIGVESWPPLTVTFLGGDVAHGVLLKKLPPLRQTINACADWSAAGGG